MSRLSKIQVQLLIALLAVLLFIPGFGAVHLFDWDEINFAEIAREMLVTRQLAATADRLSALPREAAVVHVDAGHQHVGIWRE